MTIRVRPAAILVLGLISCVLSAALLMAESSVAIRLVGYAFACLIPIAAVSFFRRSAIAREAARGEVSSAAANACAIGLIVLALVLTVIQSYLLARAILIAKDF